MGTAFVTVATIIGGAWIGAKIGDITGKFLHKIVNGDKKNEEVKKF